MKTYSNDPLLFLDIDGVLNSRKTFSEKKLKASEAIENDESLSMDARIRAHYLSMLDPELIENLNVFLDKTACHVVLSSAWRIMHGVSGMNELLKTQGFRHIVTASTPCIDEGWSVRGNEIQAWLNENRKYDFKRYVIFDDDSDMLLQQKDHFFQTSFKEGLTSEICQEAWEFLREK